jgi:hypothetical protein
MAFNARRLITIEYTPAAVASENAKLYTVPVGYFVQNVVAHVFVAGDGTGTLAFATTSGGTDLMSTANVGVTVLGRKSGGIANKVMAVATDLGVFATYTVGTATIKPVVRLSFELVQTGLRA